MPRLPKIPKSLLGKLPPGFKKPKVEDFVYDMGRLGEDLAEEFKDRVVENIETNKYGYLLSLSTIRRKGHTIPLIDSGQLLSAIYREDTIVSVEETPRDDSPLNNRELAIVHEYGVKDRGIPARPVWRTTFRDFEKEAADRVKNFPKNPKFKKPHKKRS